MVWIGGGGWAGQTLVHLAVSTADRVSIIADRDVVEVAMNGLLVWALIIGTILLVVAAVVTFLRGRVDPP